MAETRPRSMACLAPHWRTALSRTDLPRTDLSQPATRQPGARPRRLTPLNEQGDLSTSSGVLQAPLRPRNAKGATLISGWRLVACARSQRAFMTSLQYMQYMQARSARQLGLWRRSMTVPATGLSVADALRRPVARAGGPVRRQDAPAPLRPIVQARPAEVARPSAPS